MSKISETLSRSKDTPWCFMENEMIEEFLVEFGIASQFNQKPGGTNRSVQFIACHNHPTHYLLAMQNRDYVNPKENGYMLTCIPKSAETVEHFTEFCKKTVQSAKEAVFKLWTPSSSGNPPN